MRRGFSLQVTGNELQLLDENDEIMFAIHYDRQNVVAISARRYSVMFSSS